METGVPVDRFHALCLDAIAELPEEFRGHFVTDSPEPHTLVIRLATEKPGPAGRLSEVRVIYWRTRRECLEQWNLPPDPRMPAIGLEQPAITVRDNLGSNWSCIHADVCAPRVFKLLIHDALFQLLTITQAVRKDEAGRFISTKDRQVVHLGMSYIPPPARSQGTRADAIFMAVIILAAAVGMLLLILGKLG